MTIDNKPKTQENKNVVGTVSQPVNQTTVSNDKKDPSNLNQLQLSSLLQNPSNDTLDQILQNTSINYSMNDADMFNKSMEILLNFQQNLAPFDGESTKVELEKTNNNVLFDSLSTFANGKTANVDEDPEKMFSIPVESVFYGTGSNGVDLTVEKQSTTKKSNLNYIENKNFDTNKIKVLTPITSLQEHKQKIAACCFDNLGLTLASGSNDNKTIIWDISNINGKHRPIWTLGGHKKSVNIVRYCNLTGVVGNAVTAANAESIINSIPTLLVTGSIDKTVRIWKLNGIKNGTINEKEPYEMVTVFENHNWNITAADFCPVAVCSNQNIDGFGEAGKKVMVYCGSLDAEGELKIWNVVSKKILKSVKLNKSSKFDYLSNPLRFRPVNNGTFFISDSTIITLVAVYATSLIVIDFILPQQNNPNVDGCDDYTIRTRQTDHKKYISTLEWSNNGDYLITASEDMIYVWNIDTTNEFQVIYSIPSDNEKITSCIFLPDPFIQSLNPLTSSLKRICIVYSAYDNIYVWESEKNGNNSYSQYSPAVENGSDETSKIGSGICALKLLKYGECLNSLSMATIGKDLITIDSNEICSIYDTKCKDFIKDTYENIDCDKELGVLTKYATTINRLYYLSFCVKNSEGKACPVTNIIKGEQLTTKNSSELFEESCKDENCNKSFVAMTEIINKNIDNTLMYDQFIGFTNNISYKTIAKSFRENKCDSINFIYTNNEIFHNVEDLYSDIVNLFYSISIGEIPDYSSLLNMINVSNDVKKIDLSNNCLNQFNNYKNCFDSFKNYDKETIQNFKDVNKMCQKFESDDCANLLSDLKSNKVQCDNSYINDIIYRSIFIGLRFTYISACLKTEDNKDYCPISKFLQTDHKLGQVTKDFLTSMTENCENNYCNDEFYNIMDLIKESNIYNEVIPDDFNYDNFFKNLKKHSCKAFNIGLGIFEIIEDIFGLIGEIISSVINTGMELLNGVSPDYTTIKDAVKSLDKSFNIFGINKNCLAQVWSYSPCVKLFISDESYKNVHNITTTDICNIFENTSCNSFVNDLMNTDFKYINKESTNEEIYNKIFESLKFTYLSTCSKTDNNEKYCPMVEFMNSGINITEAGISDYENALKSTCEDTSCNKSYSEVYKILHENKEEKKEYDDSTINKREIIISEEDIDLEQAIDFLDKKQCVSFAKAMTNQDITATQDSSGLLSIKVNIFTILSIVGLVMISLF
ncbi:hypothetical protein PIROE2DRAFT_58343 [Piromyces sp. E2]|nr:hypothetical protein PIROE2DRAFT_58343 [Piromyces sp. E2]|eukprot:OUM68055.1 hypothetical protein PIROE2DRAFT_58343 [Piromyces sp. E2]